MASSGLNDTWMLLARFCDQKQITLEELLYSSSRRAAQIRREIWSIMYQNGWADQKRIASVFNVSQQAVSKAIKSNQAS
jgi:hypothetical protein